MTAKQHNELEGIYVRAFRAICDWAKGHQMQVFQQPLEPSHVGKFDGESFILDPSYPLAERVFYLAHAVGSALIWFVDDSVSSMFQELRAAKSAPEGPRFERALAQYQAFEIESSQFATWLLQELGFAGLTSEYSNFMRADLESMTIFHRTGVAPVWREFFANWNQEVSHGKRLVEDFSPVEISQVSPRKFELQEILQKEQGSTDENESHETPGESR